MNLPTFFLAAVLFTPITRAADKSDTSLKSEATVIAGQPAQSATAKNAPDENAVKQLRDELAVLEKEIPFMTKDTAFKRKTTSAF